MTEIATNQNLNAHYTKDAKIKRLRHPVTSAPTNMPKHHLFNDKDANNRMKAINNDIYQGFKKEENRKGTTFIKVFAGIVLAVLGFLGLKKLFK